MQQGKCKRAFIDNLDTIAINELENLLTKTTYTLANACL